VNQLFSESCSSICDFSGIKQTQGPKLYSKVLTIEPKRLLKILMAAKHICEFY